MSPAQLPLTRRQFLDSGIRVEQHGDLIYVYLDTPEAVRAAPKLLPETQRGVAPDGRELWVYRVPDGFAGFPA
jgi:hypothetical protein